MNQRPSYQKFRPTHGKRCACTTCLGDWMSFLRSRYQTAWAIVDAGNDCVMVRGDDAPYRGPVHLYRNGDFLKRVKAWAKRDDFTHRYVDETGVKPLATIR